MGKTIGKYFGADKGSNDLPPEEVEKLIVSNASDASLARYQEAVGGHIATEVSAFVQTYAEGFARHVEDSSFRDSGVVDALNEIADHIRSSTFPAKVLRMWEEKHE